MHRLFFKSMKKKLLITISLLTILLGITACSAEDIIGEYLSPSSNTAVKDLVYDSLGEITTGKPVKVESVSMERMAYKQLTEAEQEVYDQVYDCIANYKDEVVVSTKDADMLYKVYSDVFDDYGDLFWVDGYMVNKYVVNNEIVSLKFIPSYTMTLSEKTSMATAIDGISDMWLADIDPNADEYHKALYVYEYLINNVEYDTEAEENQNLVSVFINKSTVCQGYACAAWYLLDKLGIKSTIITGTANGQAHAWNLVNLDNAYYYMDVTWGNSRYTDGDSNNSKRINYAYLAANDDDMANTHQSTCTFTIPACSSNEDSYFVKEGLYFDVMDADGIGLTLANSYNNGDQFTTLKFANDDIFQECKQYFISDHKIVNYIKGITSLNYLTNTNTKTITFQWN